MIVKADAGWVRFSPKLANLLGFDRGTTYMTTTLAERLPDVYYYFCPLILCSRTLARPTLLAPSKGESLPVLRLLNFEGKMTTEGRRVTFDFQHEKRWVPLMNNQLQDVDVHVLCCDFETAPAFLRNSGGCVIELEFKRQKLGFL